MTLHKRAIDIADMDFSPYGILYDMRTGAKESHLVERNEGDGWRDANSTQPIVDTLASLGYTFGTGAPFTARQMEMHGHTQEAVFPTDQAVVFLVARAGGSAPRAEDAIPVIVRPGQVAVLHRGTWHSSAHGVNTGAYYHYLALVYKNEPTVWANIEDGPVSVSCEPDGGA
ncbi:MAG TPA: ureidoglycolate lyase [Clostridia bacterium]|nr:ureidoglycolate lyase [Clostridia bacterium]